MQNNNDYDNFVKFSNANLKKWEKWQLKVIKSYFDNQETFLVCPRQNGKTEIMIWLALFVFFILNKSVYFSTHSQKAFYRLRNRINREINLREPLTEVLNTHLNGIVKTPITNKLTGAVFTIDHRTETSATGDSYDYNFIDECQFLTNDEIASLLPTMATRKPKIFYGGTSPAPKFDFFIRLWQREQNNDNFFYYGIPADKDIPAKLNDKIVLELVKKTNPNYPAFLKKSSILLEYKRMSRVDFIRERLGVIDYSTSNLFFDEAKLSENVFNNRDFNRASLGIYALGTSIALCLSDRQNDNFYLQPLGIYQSNDEHIFNFLLSKKNKIKQINVTGTDFAIYDKYNKAFGQSKYNILKTPALYQRDMMLKNYYEENKLYLPSKKETWDFLLNIQQEIKKVSNGGDKDFFTSFDKTANCEFQAMANALYGANYFEPNAKPEVIKVMKRM